MHTPALGSALFKVYAFVTGCPHGLEEGSKDNLPLGAPVGHLTARRDADFVALPGGFSKKS
jgi:hypothetical protein